MISRWTLRGSGFIPASATLTSNYFKSTVHYTVWVVQHFNWAFFFSFGYVNHAFYYHHNTVTPSRILKKRQKEKTVWILLFLFKVGDANDGDLIENRAYPRLEPSQYNVDLQNHIHIVSSYFKVNNFAMFKKDSELVSSKSSISY